MNNDFNKERIQFIRQIFGCMAISSFVVLLFIVFQTTFALTKEVKFVILFTSVFCIVTSLIALILSHKFENKIFANYALRSKMNPDYHPMPIPKALKIILMIAALLSPVIMAAITIFTSLQK